MNAVPFDDVPHLLLSPAMHGAPRPYATLVAVAHVVDGEPVTVNVETLRIHSAVAVMVIVSVPLLAADATPSTASIAAAMAVNVAAVLVA